MRRFPILCPSPNIVIKSGRIVKCKDMDWISVAKDRFQWQSFVNALMNLLFP
jgi:hypothetical protein